MAASFVQFSNTFVVNSFTSGDQTTGQASKMPDGSFVSSYISADQPVSGATGTVIRLAHFNPDGTRAGPDLLVSTATNNNQTNPSTRVLPDGKLMVSWMDGTSGALLAAVYNPDLSVATSQFTVTQTSSADTTSGTPGIDSTVTIGSGPVLLTWTTTTATGDLGGTSRAVRGRLMNEDGTPASAEFALNTTTAGDQARPRSALLGNGNFLVTFMSQDSSGVSDQNIRAQIFTTAGVAVGSEFILTSITSGDQSRPVPISLADGRTLVVWESSDSPGDGSGTSIRYRFLNSSGVPQGTDQIAETTTVSNQRFPQAQPLTDGRIAFFWESFESAGFVTFRARVMNADGSWDGNDQALLTGAFTPTTASPNYQLKSIGNGEFYLTWSSPSAGGGTNDASGNGVQGEMFVLAPSGSLVSYDTTNGGVTLTGSSSTANWLKGGTGADTLTGGIGANTLFGGNGNDTFIAGTGTNFMFGGAGNDKFQIPIGANLVNGLFVGGEGIGSSPAPGEVNTLECNPLNAAGAGIFDFRTADISGITNIQCDTTSGSVVLDFYATQFPSLQGVSKASATVTANIFVDAAHSLSTLDTSGVAFSGFGGGDALVFDASALTTAITMTSASVASTLKGGSGDDTFYGKLADTIQGGAGYDTLYLAAGSAFRGYAMGASSIEQLITSENGNQVHAVSNADGTIDEATYDTAATQTYSFYANHYTSNWTLYLQQFVDDNGDQRNLGYDISNSQPFSYYQNTYNSVGQLLTQQILDDNGNQRVVGFDVASSQPFTSYVNTYDTSNRLVLQQILDDNGNNRVIGYDVDNLNPWSYYVNTYNPSGVLINSLLVPDP